MAGLTSTSPTPDALTVHAQSKVLEISFSDGATFRIPFELMRIMSPSAEVQGHGPGQEILQTGKRNVGYSQASRTGTTRVSFRGIICTFWARSKTPFGPITANA
jgi:DUF971 family protein